LSRSLGNVSFPRNPSLIQPEADRKAPVDFSVLATRLDAAAEGGRPPLGTVGSQPPETYGPKAAKSVADKSHHNLWKREGTVAERMAFRTAISVLRKNQVLKTKP